jgi:hypothetical protein
MDVFSLQLLKNSKVKIPEKHDAIDDYVFDRKNVSNYVNNSQFQTYNQ